MKSSSYLRFLNAVKAIEGQSQLDAIQKKLLDKVMMEMSREIDVLVGDLLALKALGSQATLHGRIKKLSEEGYVDLVMDTVDNRKKIVTPTKLSSCLSQASYA
jgi:DNA-binding MarR family transcriptional regulator